jgi:outer membrane murein-binding lipoprotein Lpp
MLLDDKDAFTDANRTLQLNLDISNSEIERLSGELATQTAEVSKLTQWVEQLQADLRMAIELAAERNEKINELTAPVVEESNISDQHVFIEPHYTNTDNPIDFPPPMVEEPEQAVDDGRGYQEKYFPKYSAPVSDFTDDEIPDSGSADFGIKFPDNPGKGDLFLRVDSLPAQLYKWNSTKWIEVDRNITDRFAYNTAYVEHLTNKLRTGEYELDDLSDAERVEVTNYLNGKSIL